MIKAGRKKAKEQKEKEISAEPSSSAEAENPPTAAKCAFPVHVSTASTRTDYHLRGSFIMDSDASAHVSNQREQFCNLTPAGPADCVYGSDEIIPIEGIGSGVAG